jgi:hypothetical protein
MVYTSTSTRMVLIKIYNLCLLWGIIIFTQSCFEISKQPKIKIKNSINNKMDQILVNSNQDCEIKIMLSQIDNIKVHCIIEIKNKTSKTLYMFNKLYTDITKERSFVIDKNLFYTKLQDSILIFAKAIIPVPKGLFVEKKIYPCCSKILTNQDFREEIDIDLPIELYDPYVEENIGSKKQYPIVFRFGYFLGYSKTESMEIKAISNVGEVIIFNPFDYNFQKIIEVGVFNPLPIKN